MANLFFPDNPLSHSYNRDSKGRFADKKDGKIDRLERENARLRYQQKCLLSQITGFSKMIRMKDEENLKLKNGAQQKP